MAPAGSGADVPLVSAHTKAFRAISRDSPRPATSRTASMPARIAAAPSPRSSRARTTRCAGRTIPGNRVKSASRTTSANISRSASSDTGTPCPAVTRTLPVALLCVVMRRLLAQRYQPFTQRQRREVPPPFPRALSNTVSTLLTASIGYTPADSISRRAGSRERTSTATEAVPSSSLSSSQRNKSSSSDNLRPRIAPDRPSTQFPLPRKFPPNMNPPRRRSEEATRPRCSASAESGQPGDATGTAPGGASTGTGGGGPGFAASGCARLMTRTRLDRAIPAAAHPGRMESGDR